MIFLLEIYNNQKMVEFRHRKPENADLGVEMLTAIVDPTMNLREFPWSFEEMYRQFYHLVLFRVVNSQDIVKIVEVALESRHLLYSQENHCKEIYWLRCKTVRDVLLYPIRNWPSLGRELDVTFQKFHDSLFVFVLRARESEV